MKKRCCIVGAAPINNYKKIKDYLKEDCFFVFCDAGLKHKEPLGVSADLIVGDFDSYEKEDFIEETIVLPTVKDDTDTGYAIKECLKRGFRDFVLIGCVGDRLDHTLGNIALLNSLDKSGVSALIVDDFSDIQIVSNDVAYVEDSFSYFSLLAFDGDASGVTITDAFYELDNTLLTGDYPLGVSNEPIKGKTAKISVKGGKLLLVRVW